VNVEPGEVLLVRHAETEWSLGGRHTGRTDVQLTGHGRESASALRTRLGDMSFDLVLVSLSARARETCELSGCSENAQERADLLEWDYGDYEGLTSAEIQAIRPGWRLWRDGCPGGESAGDVGERADRVIAALRERGGTAAVFSHGHMLRVLGARWVGLGPERGGSLGLSTAALCTLSSEHGAPIIARWNLA
jgi:broad specificity phosphatase PhoE